MEFTIVARNFKYPRESLSERDWPRFLFIRRIYRRKRFRRKNSNGKTLLKGVDVEEKIPDSDSDDIKSRLEEEEAWIAEDELFELWIVHTIIREEERLRKEREGSRSIFTHKGRDTDREEQDLLYDEDYDGAEDEGEVYDDYENYWDGYDSGDVDDLDLDV